MITSKNEKNAKQRRCFKLNNNNNNEREKQKNVTIREKRKRKIHKNIIVFVGTAAMTVKFVEINTFKKSLGFVIFSSASCTLWKREKKERKNKGKKDNTY